VNRSAAAWNESTKKRRELGAASEAKAIAHSSVVFLS